MQTVAGGEIDVDKAKPERQIMHVCEADGTPIRPLIDNLISRNLLDRQGAPDVSADGNLVAFDAWPSDQGFAWDDARIVVVNMDGTNVRDISDGVMPSFSPDGTKLVCSRAAKNTRDERFVYQENAKAELTVGRTFDSAVAVESHGLAGLRTKRQVGSPVFCAGKRP